MKRNDIRQVAFRLTREQWKVVRNYLTENDMTFQALVLKLLEKELSK